jgi:membrane fusion protein, multidrug efflux system
MKAHSKFLILPVMLLVFSCGDKDELTLKKEELEQLKRDAVALKVSIEKLENEITSLDPAFGKANRKSVLISTIQPTKQHFEHYVEVTGSVLSKKNVSISGEVVGTIQQVMAVEGMRVTKGQLLARIDAESIENSIDELKTQLDLATIIFEKQERLWKQQIGTEVQYLEAKNRKETLEKSLAGLSTQSDRTTVRAPFTGTVETVLVRLGELVQPGTPMFQFIGDDELFVEADVSERYTGIINKGDSVEISFPSVGKSYKTKVSAVGGVINTNNRTFKVEVFLPKLTFLKPNMISVLEIKDYENLAAVTVPNYLILQDNNGDYVFIVDNGVSKKRYVERGVTFQETTEITEGLDGTEVLVDKGFREVGENFNVNIAQ